MEMEVAKRAAVYMSAIAKEKSSKRRIVVRLLSLRSLLNLALL
jgi:hypothetical protein